MGDFFSTWNNYCSGHVDQKARPLLRAVLHFSSGQFPENSETPRVCGNVMQYVLPFCTGHKPFIPTANNEIYWKKCQSAVNICAAFILISDHQIQYFYLKY